MTEEILNFIQNIRANYVIINGTDRLGSYFRLKPVKQANSHELPKEVISAQYKELIHEHHPHLQCNICNAKIDTTTKIYTKKDKRRPTSSKEDELYCRKHFRNQKIAENL